jgi:hypothetical protein
LEQIDQSYPLALPIDPHNNLLAKLANMTDPIKSLAEDYKDDATQILAILRVLERLHREICNDLLQPALPNSRHSLFDLLRDIDANGGWPYIYRMSLKELCSNLQELEDPDSYNESESELT